MDRFEKILKGIESIRIQGSENVAVSAVKAFQYKALASETKSYEKFFNELDRIRERVFGVRPTEPLMRNCIRYVISNLKESPGADVAGLKKLLKKFCMETLDHMDFSERMIAKIATHKIHTGMIIFTHCHSSTVMNILREAKKEGNWFKVYNTETRPLFQGRITARELSKIRIPVTHFVDSAARIAIRKSDVILFGVDAITTTKIYNKIGSEMFAVLANKYDVPLYICGDSWKFDPEGIYGFEETVEKRGPEEIWKNPPRGVKIENPTFERINPDLVTAIISELGVYSPENFVEEVKKAYPWLCGLR
jgi:ribose 1,5-bisphosphate isomerase